MKCRAVEAARAAEVWAQALLIAQCDNPPPFGRLPFSSLRDAARAALGRTGQRQPGLVGP